MNRERLALLRSDEQGELPAAALASMPPGAMLLCLSDPGERFVATEVVLEATGRVEVELERGVMMELKVLGEGGEPLERAEATVWQLGSGKWRRFHLAGGAGRLGPLPFGPSKLVLEAPGQVTSLLDMELKPARKKPAPAASRTVRLQRGGASLRGRVALGKGTAMPREVLLRYDGAGQVREPGADGSFQFSGLAPLPGGAPRPAQLVVLKLDGKELYAREVAIGGGDVDVGILGLGR